MELLGIEYLQYLNAKCKLFVRYESKAPINQTKHLGLKAVTVRQ